MRKPRPGEVSIEKPDTPAGYTCARVLLGGLAPVEAKRRAMVSRIMGARDRQEHTGDLVGGIALAISQVRKLGSTTLGRLL